MPVGNPPGHEANDEPGSEYQEHRRPDQRRRPSSHLLIISAAFETAIVRERTSPVCGTSRTVNFMRTAISLSYVPEHNALMLLRIWHGWTLPGNANAYENLLKEEIFVGIGKRRIRGYHGIELLRRENAGEVEFITIMRFDDIESVREFAGADYEVAVVPAAARALLSHFDAQSQHYELRAARAAGL